MRALDISGQKFGRLTAIEYAGTKRGRRIYICECQCGYTVEKSVLVLRSAAVRSCGCLYAETRQSTHKTHGETSKGRFTPEYRAWVKMKERCGNPNEKSYKWYGARGIYVCPEWIDSFECFLHDMGRKPSKAYSIERLNNDKPYEPSNCVWGTARQQSRNTRRNRMVMLRDTEMPLIVALEKMGHKGNATIYSRTIARLNRGLSFEAAMSEPSRYGS